MCGAALLQKRKRFIELTAGIVGERHHNIAADVCKTGLPGPQKSLFGLLRSVWAAKALQLFIISTLHAKADAIHSRRAKPGQGIPSNRFRVGFERNFSPGQRVGCIDQLGCLCGGKQAGGAAAKVYGGRSAAAQAF